MGFILNPYRFGGPTGLLASDTFTRADTIVSPGSTEVGAFTWTQASNFGITSNELYHHTNILTPGDKLLFAFIDTGASSIDVEIDVTTAQAGNTVNAGLLFRYGDGNNFWRLIIGRNSGGSLIWVLGKRVSGTFTTIDSGTPSAATGVLRVTDDGTNVEAFIDGVSVGTGSDSALGTNTKQGVIISYSSVSGANSGTGWRFDDFTVYENGTRP